jgi:hypothetical protein
MDPVTIFAILGGILAGGSVASEINKQDKDGGPVIVRTVWTSGPNDAEQWRATELLSEEALKDTGRLFDLDMEAWWPMVESNTVRVVVLAELSGRKDRHVVFRAIKVAGGWTLDVAYGTSGAKVQKHQLQRINAVLKNMSWIQSRVDYPMDPIAQPLYNVGGPNAIWILDRYLIEKTSKLLQMSLDDYMQHYAMAGDRTAYAYAIADTSSGMPKVAFVLQVVDGEYSLDEARGIHNRVPTEVEQDLIETFIDDLNEQGAVEGVLPGHVPGLPAAVPESRQLEVDELEGVYDIPEREYDDVMLDVPPKDTPEYEEYAERKRAEREGDEEDDMSMMPEPSTSEESRLVEYLRDAPSEDSSYYSVYAIDNATIGALVGAEMQISNPSTSWGGDDTEGPFLMVEWVKPEEYGYFFFDADSMESGDPEDYKSNRVPRLIAAFMRVNGKIEAHGHKNERIKRGVGSDGKAYDLIQGFFGEVDKGHRDLPEATAEAMGEKPYMTPAGTMAREQEMRGRVGVVEDDDEDLDDDEDIVEGADELETYLLNSKSIDSGDYSIYPVGEELAPLVGANLEISLNAHAIQAYNNDGIDAFILVEWVDADKFGYFFYDTDEEDGEPSKRPRIIAAFYRTPEGQIYAYGPRNEPVDEMDPYYETIEAFYARLDDTRGNPGLIVDDENEELEEEEEEGLIDAALGLFDGIFDGDDEDDEDDEDLDDPIDALYEDDDGNTFDADGNPVDFEDEDLDDEDESPGSMGLFYPPDRATAKAYDEGIAAAESGEPRSQNPYGEDRSVPTSAWWTAGWTTAKRDLDDEDDDSEDLDDYDESLYDEAAIEDALEGQTENLLEGGSFLDAGDELEWDEVEAEDVEIDSDDELDTGDEFSLD